MSLPKNQTMGGAGMVSFDHKTDKEDMPNMSIQNLNGILDFQKMVFIYNAVNDGWTTRILPDGKYEFRKQDHTVSSNECLDVYLRDFLKFCSGLQPSNP